MSNGSRGKEEAKAGWKEIHTPVLKQRTKEKCFLGRWPQRKPSVRINENWPWILLCWVHGPQISDSKISRMKHDTYKLDADCFIEITHGVCSMLQTWVKRLLRRLAANTQTCGNVSHLSTNNKNPETRTYLCIWRQMKKYINTHVMAMF